MTLDIIASNTTTCGMIFHNKHTRFVLSPLVPQVGILPAEIGIERLNQQKGDLVNRTRGFCQQKMGWNPNQDGFSLDKVALVFLVMPPNWLQFILFFFHFLDALTLLDRTCWNPWNLQVVLRFALRESKRLLQKDSFSTELSTLGPTCPKLNMEPNEGQIQQVVKSFLDLLWKGSMLDFLGPHNDLTVSESW